MDQRNDVGILKMAVVPFKKYTRRGIDTATKKKQRESLKEEGRRHKCNTGS